MSWSARRVRLGTATVFLVASLVSACSPAPCSERRHDTGLLLICPDEATDMPEELKAAASFAGSLAEDHPDLFGYPWPNPGTRELEVRVTGSSGEAAAREWIAGNAKRTAPKPPPIELPRPRVPVKFVTVDRSVRRLTEIQHGSLPATDLPDGDAIWMVGPDHKRNAIVITFDHLSDRLLRALASRYGTSAIAIRIDPNPHFRN